MTDRYLFPAAVFIILLSLFADYLTQPTISMVGADAPDTIYSGERALNILAYLLPGNQPHPTGSLENKKVKKRITEWLSKEEITFEEQHAWGCHPDRGRCAWVENIIATVPGTVEEPYVALMAHYDSVQVSPGAGDDGLGTAIIMEIARMLKQQKGNRNPLMLVITDGEENVLMGARAFFSQHPLAKQIGVVLNMEGTGSKGQSRLFRTSGGNADALSAYRQFSAHPLGSSFAGELFKLLPSDTDMTVASQYGLPSADIGFSGQGNHHYHTMGDNTRNMDPMTVQHHGDNLYAMVRGLINQDLNVLSSDVQIYDNIYGYFFTWTRHVDQAILLIAFFLLVASTMPIRTGIFGRLLSPLLLFVAIALTMAVVFVGLHFLRGETPFRPPFVIPYRMLTFGVPSLVGLLTARWMNQYWELEQFVTGIWWFWWLLAVTLVFVAPNAAYILTVPVLCGATLILVGRWLGQGKRQYFFLLSLVIVVPFSLVKVGQLNEWQNYWLVLITVPFFALCLSVVMPFVRGPLVNPAILVASLVVVAGAGLSLYLPSYSEEKPHTMNYQVIQNQDSEKAWIQYLSFNAPPSYIMRAFDHEEVIYPWGDKVIDDLSSDTTFSDVDPVQIKVVQQLHKGKRDVQIMLLGNQKAMWMGLVIPPHALLSGFTLDGMTFDITPAWWSDWQENLVLEFRGVQEKQVDVVLHFDSGSETKAWIFEVMSELPGQFKDDLDAREGRALPIHDGDRFIVFREVSL